MARPKVALIRRDEVFDAALALIDRDGIDNFSMRTLAASLDVNAASLYHHFKNKDEILDGVAKLVLDRHARVVIDETAPWNEQLLAMMLAAADALAEHPNIVPILVRRSDRAFAVAVHERLAKLLLDAGVPARYIMPLLDLQESLLIGTAVLDANEASAVPYTVDRKHFPSLSKVITANRADTRRRLEMGTRALLAGWVSEVVPNGQPRRRSR